MFLRKIIPALLLILQTGLLVAVPAADDARDQKVYERYLSLLRRNPRQGTALTRVLNWHRDRSTLDAFKKDLQAAVQDRPADGASWMLLGLVAEEQSDVVSAAEAYRNAEKNRPEDHLAPWSLGRVLQKQRQNGAARDALERALKLKPSRTDASAIYQSLATLYGGASTAEAAAFWRQFEEAFPDDPRVQEQLVESLIQQGRLDDAIERLLRVAAGQSDPARRIPLQLRIAELRMRSGAAEEGRRDLIELQSAVRPGSWLFSEIRRRIDAAFLRQQNFPGLISFYRERTAEDPGDSDAILRLSRYLALSGESRKATETLRRAVESAPRDQSLRGQFVVRLKSEQKFKEAIVLLEAQENLSLSELEQLGRLYLNRSDLELRERQRRAVSSWRRQLLGREDDAAAWSQVAGLCRDSGLTADAVDLYQKAIEVAPQTATYREYLGDLYHQTGRPAEAIKAWKGIVQDSESAEQWSQLARILQGRGYAVESLSAWSSAVDAGVSGSVLLEYARQLRESGDPVLAMKQLDEAAATASDPRVQQQIQSERLRCLAESGQLETRSRQLAELLAEGSGNASDWLLLARTEEALNRWTRAASAARNAAKLQPDSIDAWTIAARVLERAGQLADASRAWSQIAQLDVRSQNTALRRMITLEQNLGRTDRALAAAEKLIAAAPNSNESLQFVAEMCFDLKRPDRAIEFLTRAVQANPSDRSARALRADAYARQFRTSDAINDWWAAFELAQGQQEALIAVRALAVLYQRTGRLDQLVNRLEALPREEESVIDPVLCVIELWKTAGQPGKARTLLQTLPTLMEDPRLLEEATVLSEQSQDFRSAAEYQRLQNQLRPSKQGLARLAGLLVRAGELSPSEAEWMKHGGEFANPYEILGSIDHAIEMNLLDDANSLGRRMSERFRGDWECLLRRAVTAWKRGQLDECETHCDSLLSLSVSEAPVAWRHRKTSEAAAAVDPAVSDDPRPALILNLERLRQFGRRLHLAGGGTAESRPWAAETFNEARSIATFLKLRRAFDDGRADKFVTEQLTHAEADSSAALRWDCWSSIQALRLVEGRYSPALMKSAFLVRQLNTDAAHLAWLYSVAHRSDSRFRKEQAEPLPDEFLSAVQSSFQQLRRSRPTWLNYTGGLELVTRELTLAGRRADAEQLVSEIEEGPPSSEDLKMLFQWAAGDGDLVRMLTTAERIARQPNLSTVGRPWQQRFATAAWHALQQNDRDAVDLAIRGYLETAADLCSRRLSGGVVPVAGYHSSQRVQILRGHSDWAVQQVDALNPETLCEPADIEFLANVSQMFRGLDRQHPIRICDSFAAARQDAVGRAFAAVAVAQLEFLRGRPEVAMTRLVRAAELQPDNGAVRLFIARYQHEQGASADAQALVATIKPGGYEMVRQANLLLLDLAEATGDSAIADSAVQKLLSLRLDKATATRVSRQLQRLGRESLQTQVDQRVAVTEGGNMDVMVALMRQKVQEQHLTIACEIAHQILRQTRGQEIGNRRGESISSIRRSAIQTLEAGEQLSPLITQAKQMLERDDKSVAACEQLVEFFAAIDNRAELERYRKRLQALRPVTVDSLVAEAEAAEQNRRFGEACVQYLAVFERDPQRYALNYYRYLDTFDQGGRLSELTTLLLKKDLRRLQNNYFVVNETIQRLFKAAQGSPHRRELRQSALDLFAAAWELFPNNRTFLIGEISDSEIWELPLMVKYVQNGLIPSTRQQAVASPWKIIVGNVQTDPFMTLKEGEVSGTLKRLIPALKRQDALNSFAEKVNAAMNELPEWEGGPLLLAVLKAELGDMPAAQQLLKRGTTMDVPADAAMLIARQLSSRSELTPQLISLLESSLSSGAPVLRLYDGTAGRMLVELMIRNGAGPQARSIALETLGRTDLSTISGSDVGKQRLTSAQQLFSVSRQFARLGQFVAALEFLEMMRQQTAEIPRDMLFAAGTLRRQCLERVQPQDLVDWLIQGSAESPPDLLLSVPEKPENRLKSLVIDRLAAAAPESLPKLLGTLNLKLKQKQSNLAVAIAAFVVAQRSGMTEAGQPARDWLTQWVKVAPDRKQSTEIALWLVARELPESSMRQILATRATDAAESLGASGRLQSILQEEGEIALKRGQPELADRAWSRLLGVVMSSTGSRDADSVSSSVRELRARLLQQD